MKFLELQLLTENIDQTSHFYHDILGLQIVSSGNEAVKFSAGQSVLSFTRSFNEQPVYHFAFNLPHNRFSEAMSWAGAKFELIKISPSSTVADFKSWNAMAF